MIAMATPRTRAGSLLDAEFARPQEIPAPEGFAESLAAFRAARRSGGQPAAEQLLRERMLAEAKADLEAQRLG
jgi:hypothetical protein